MISNFVAELEWRGMLHDAMPGTEEHLLTGMQSAYVGIDPTADSLHIGHLVIVMMLPHFQLAGHKPVALVGGATGMIGDPSGKSSERNLLDETTLRLNQESLKEHGGRHDFRACLRGGRYGQAQNGQSGGEHCARAGSLHRKRSRLMNDPWVLEWQMVQF
jgi:tyrosyl-tRNA synthetase